MNSLPDSGLILYASRNFSLSTTKLSMKQTSSTPFSMRKLDLLFSNNCSASSVERFLFLRSEM